MGTAATYWWLPGVVVLGLATIIVAWRVAKKTAARQRRLVDETATRQRHVLIPVFGTFALVVVPIMAFVHGVERLLWLAAILPGYFAIQHGINTAIFKNPRFFDGRQQSSYDHWDGRVVKALKTLALERRYYSTASLALRFVLPSLVFFIAAMAVGDTLVFPPSTVIARLDERFITGAPLGALGAYLYVLLFIGGRTMRGDVTPAALIWASVTIVCGPLFAGVLQLLVVNENQPATTGWSGLAIPFAAGFSVRVTVEFVDAMIRRIFLPRAAEPRSESLRRIRGITHEVEERLIEEGVTDVTNLANANPQRLRRNTRFDKRQIMSWIDEALLMTYLPGAWPALEADGITGAIDLVWYVDYAGGLPAIREVVARTGVNTTASMSQGAQSLINLATRNKLDPASLAEIMLRMYSDAQVQLIWGLYQLDDGGGDDGGSAWDSSVPEDAEAEPRGDGAEPSGSTPDLALVRNQIYENNRNLFLVHS